MTLTRTSLAGRRGWTTVASLTALLGALVTVQLPVANADAEAPRSAAAATRVSALEQPAPDPVDGLTRLPSTPASAAPAPVPPQPAPPAAPVISAAVTQPTAPVAPPAPAAPVPPPAPVASAAPAAPAVAAAPAAAGLCSGAGFERRRGEAALASLRAGAARTGFSVTFQAGRSGLLGLTHLQEGRIDMYVRSCEKQPVELLRHVMAHELGHAWDTNRMTDARRTAYLAARGIPTSTPWYGCSGCTDFATPAGDFAEVYAQWARGASTNRSQLGGDAGGAQLASLAQQFFGA